MLDWEYWMWPSVEQAVHSTRTLPFVENDETHLICLKERQAQMDAEALVLCHTIDANFRLHNTHINPSITV